MKLDNSELYNFFIEKDITHLHHANTVATSITFLRNNGLISRGNVEAKGLFQTNQDSDSDDKTNDVWNDIFFDTKDLHGYFPRQNLYGPVLFKFTSDLIIDENLEFFITKDNPIYWTSKTPYGKKYFTGIEDLRSNWDKFALHKKMLTIRKPNKDISFDHLESVILDNPRVTIYDNTRLWPQISGSINAAVNHRFQVQYRECDKSCFCHPNYLHQYSTQKLAKFFLPNSHPQFVNL